MGFLMPKQSSPPPLQQPAAAPPPPPMVGAAPAFGKKAKPRGGFMPSFLGQETSPDSTNVSNKTLLGQ